MQSLADIMDLAEQTPLSSIPLPTNLYRVRLCNGTEVYLLQHELQLLTGNYLILQTVEVHNLLQTFLTDIGPGQNPADPDPISPVAPKKTRSDLFALKLKYYSQDFKISHLSAPPAAGQMFNNGNIATVYWQAPNKDRMAYNVNYDKLDRMHEARFAMINSSNTL